MNIRSWEFDIEGHSSRGSRHRSNNSKLNDGKSKQTGEGSRPEFSGRKHSERPKNYLTGEENKHFLKVHTPLCEHV